MAMSLQRVVEKIAFPAPSPSYSLASHAELFFVRVPPSRRSHPGVPCMLYPAPRGSQTLVVHLHSNACDIGELRPMMEGLVETLGAHVLAVEFPGYGLHNGSPSMAAIDESVRQVVDFLRDDLKVDLSQVMWYGRSIGTGPAARAAHYVTKVLGHRPAGLVLQCGYASFPDVAGHLFGRVAKSLVGPLWPNAALVGALDCPVLVLHGRNDAVIPVGHAERLWAEVRSKEPSRLCVCECGHDDFDFLEHMAGPMALFLKSVVSSSTYPSAKFTLAVPQANLARVHDLASLRFRIPVHYMRQKGVENWVRERLRTSRSSAAVAAATATELERMTRSSSKASEGLEAEERSAESEARGSERSGCSPKATAEGAPVLDLSESPAVEDIDDALLDAGGVVRTCAVRVSAFLDHIQHMLEGIEDLEQRSTEEIVDMVEAHFRILDPLLSLWEEVDVATGRRVRFRLGPFWIDNTGGSAREHCLRPGDVAAAHLRIPMWQFPFPRADLRYLAEWSLLRSGCLERSLPDHDGPSAGASSCCIPPMLFRRPSIRRTRKPPSGRAGQPSKCELATSLAASFAQWVDGRDEVKAMFRRFASLYASPECALAGVDAPTAEAPVHAPVEARPPAAKPSHEDAPLGKQADSPGGRTTSSGGETAFFSIGSVGAEEPGLSRCPLQFSISARALLRDGLGQLPSDMVELQARVWGEGGAHDGGAHLCDFRRTARLLTAGTSAPLRDAAVAGRPDWAVARLALHYERLAEEPRPLRPELRAAGLALSRASAAFAATESRTRRRSEPRKEAVATEARRGGA